MSHEGGGSSQQQKCPNFQAKSKRKKKVSSHGLVFFCATYVPDFISFQHDFVKTKMRTLYRMYRSFVLSITLFSMQSYRLPVCLLNTFHFACILSSPMPVLPCGCDSQPVPSLYFHKLSHIYSTSPTHSTLSPPWERIPSCPSSSPSSFLQ